MKQIHEYHDVLPVGNEKHATVHLVYTPALGWPTNHYITGVWKSGWDFPMIYESRYQPNMLDNNNKED